eukprot:UN1498
MSSSLVLKGSRRCIDRLLLRLAALSRSSSTSSSISGGDMLDSFKGNRTMEHIEGMLNSARPALVDTPLAEVATATRSSASGETAADCWALGFTPELCCNVDQFGEGGNPACWDGPYSFEVCCTGIFADPEFWASRDPAR